MPCGKNYDPTSTNNQSKQQTRTEAFNCISAFESGVAAAVAIARHDLQRMGAADRDGYTVAVNDTEVAALLNRLKSQATLFANDLP